MSQVKEVKVAGIEVLAISHIEVGERAKLYGKTVDASGVYLNAASMQWDIEVSDASVLRVEEEAVVGVAAGEAIVTMTARAKDCRAVQKSIEVRVMGSAGEKPYSEVTPHPRILFMEEELQSLRQRVSSPEMETQGVDVQTSWAELREQGERYLKESGFRVTYANAPDVIDVVYPLMQPVPLPNPPGYIDYPFWTMYSRGIEHRLITLSLVYALTGDVRYADKAKAMLLDLARYQRWYEFPERGAEGNLSNAHFTLGAATAYDILQGMLSDEERQAVRTAILEKGLRPMAIDFGNDDQHNIIVAKQVAMMVGALAILDEDRAAAKYVTQARDYMYAYLESRIESAETEGLMYNNIAATHLAQAASALKKTTGDASLIEHPFLTVVVPEQFFYFLSAGQVPTFANLSDCHPKLDLSYMMSMLAEHAGNGAAMWYVRQYEAKRQSVLLNIRKGTEAVTPERYFAGRASKAFPSIGWSALRSGWGERDHLLAFTSSPSARGHNHLDQNHFIMNVAGEWLITDPGYQDYRPGPKNEFTDGSVGHNVLIVNGQGQQIRGGGTLDAWHMSALFDAVRGDATASYGGAIRQWHRTVAHIAAKYAVIIDDIALRNADDQAELLLHTSDANRITFAEQAAGSSNTLNELPGGDSSIAFSIYGERAAVHIHTASSHGAESAVTKYPGAEEYGPYLVFRLRAGEDGRTRFVTLLAPDPDGAAMEDSLSDCNLEWVDGKTVVTMGGRDRLSADANGTLTWIRLPEEHAAMIEAGRPEEPEAWALFAGQYLNEGGRELLSFSLPASGSVRRIANAYEAAFTLPADCDIHLAIASAVSILGENHEVIPVSYAEDGRIALTLPAGEHRIKITTA